NHLDVESLEWLERELQSIDAGIMVVAHDRWFLEAIANAVLELEAGRSTYFSGPWHAWRIEKASRLHAASKAADRVGRDIERLERFVARFRASTEKMARKAQVKLTQIERFGEDDAPRDDPRTARAGRGIGPARTRRRGGVLLTAGDGAGYAWLCPSMRAARYQSPATRRAETARPLPLLGLGRARETGSRPFGRR